MIKVIFSFAALVAGATAIILFNPRELVVHECREDAPAGYTMDGPAPGNTTLKFRLSLVQSNIEGLQDTLMDVSTPNSTNYGKHLSKEEVNAFVAPTSETVNSVQAWLSDSGLNATALSPAGDWLGLETTVEYANELFCANFSVFTNQATGDKTIRTLSYSIPAGLKGHLELVYPMITFPDPHRSEAPLFITPYNTDWTNASSGSDHLITPARLLELYKIPTNATPETSNRLAVPGFNGEYANKKDLKIFLKNYTDLDPSTNFTLQTVDGGQNSQNRTLAGIEANLDVQYTVGIASGVSTEFISVGPDPQDPNGPSGFIDLVNFLLLQDSLPRVLSTSYATNEANLTSALAHKLCNGFAQLGARGTSVLFASGDYGVSGVAQGTNCTTFVPTFPAGCPFITSVGATQDVSRETGATLSSGGFSNYFPRPSYQSSVVPSYLDALDAINEGRFNVSGRGYPDVAAVGVNVTIVVDREAQPVDGTSASTPIFASVVALLNGRLIAAGKSPLGFLNPFLYSGAGAQALNDITFGNNPGCGTQGFQATTGWDPVTGLGLPNFEALLKAVGL